MPNTAAAATPQSSNLTAADMHCRAVSTPSGDVQASTHNHAPPRAEQQRNSGEPADTQTCCSSAPLIHTPAHSFPPPLLAVHTPQTPTEYSRSMTTNSHIHAASCHLHSAALCSNAASHTLIHTHTTQQAGATGGPLHCSWLSGFQPQHAVCCTATASTPTPSSNTQSHPPAQHAQHAHLLSVFQVVHTRQTVLCLS